MAAPLELVLLVLAALGAGALNSVAGGGSFLTFPALLAIGVPAIPANATNSVALWPGVAASAVGYREDLATARRVLPGLALTSAAGAALGALLLLLTPPATFGHAVPWLLLAATLAFAFGGPLVERLRRHENTRTTSPVPLLAAQFLIAIYGGYFGGGMGILMLAAFTVLGLEHIHAMNGLKAVLAVAIKAVAITAFAIAGIVVWSFAALMVLGAVTGGYAGARLARRVDPRFVRAFVILAGAALSAHYFANPPV